MSVSCIDNYSINSCLYKGFGAIYHISSNT